MDTRYDTCPSSGIGDRGQPSLAKITDGTSNTMIVSEVVVGIARGRNDEERDIKLGVAINEQNVTLFSLHDGVPSGCAAMRASGNQIRSDCPVLRNQFVPNAKASRWLDGRNIYALYKAALPPNSPSCIGSELDQWDGSFETAEEYESLGPNIISASSYHTGGVNVCMADGAVRFVSDSVDYGDINYILGYEFTRGTDGVIGSDLSGYLNHPATLDDARGHWWTGASTYGVWGALATPAGGESKSL
jgi:prepilin-type processing-associated H-X9-DG protein